MILPFEFVCLANDDGLTRAQDGGCILPTLFPFLPKWKSIKTQNPHSSPLNSYLSPVNSEVKTGVKISFFRIQTHVIFPAASRKKTAIIFPLVE
jgi:hypothetical protein